MTDSPAKPRGRRPGRADTRGTICRAALTLFSTIGYDKVSLRAIAREADVDPALIHHYFSSKSDLFAQTVLDLPLEAGQVVSDVLNGPREQIGERAVAAFLAAYDSPESGRDRFTAMLAPRWRPTSCSGRSASSCRRRCSARSPSSSVIVTIACGPSSR